MPRISPEDFQAQLEQRTTALAAAVETKPSTFAKIGVTLAALGAAGMLSYFPEMKDHTVSKENVPTLLSDLHNALQNKQHDINAAQGKGI